MTSIYFFLKIKLQSIKNYICIKLSLINQCFWYLSKKTGEIMKNELINKILLKQEELSAKYKQSSIKGVRKKIYYNQNYFVDTIFNYPFQKAKSDEKLPVYMNLHGGAFIEGDAVLMDSFCQKLADQLNILVVNINYKLSPNYIFPYQLEEIKAVEKYMIENEKEINIDINKIGIGGFSAGATLAIGSVTRSILEGKNIYRNCMCAYPLTNAMPNSIDSNHEFEVIDEEMEKALEIYFDGAEANPLNTVLMLEDELLSQFQSVILFTCGKDSLRDQGINFVEKLINNGVWTYYKEYHKALHGFVEVNQPDYFIEDPRKNVEQLYYSKQAENFIVNGFKAMLIS